MGIKRKKAGPAPVVRDTRTEWQKLSDAGDFVIARLVLLEEGYLPHIAVRKELDYRLKGKAKPV